MTKPLVSIVIPCYNAAKFIEQALQSALEQGDIDIEVLLIDDGSTDGTSDIVAKFSDRCRTFATINKGAPAARNLGLSHSQGEYVKFLDSDDYLLPHSLKEQVHAAESLPRSNRSVVYGDVEIVDELGRKLRTTSLACNKSQHPLARILSCNPITSSPLHRKEYLVAIGGFNEELPRRQEDDLHFRLALAGVTFVHVPRTIYCHRMHNEPYRISGRSQTQIGASFWFEYLTKQESALRDHFSGSIPSDVRVALSKRFWSSGRGLLREGQREEAKKCMRSARNLAPTECIEGKLPYRLLCRMFGASLAESGTAMVRRLSTALGQNKEK